MLRLYCVLLGWRGDGLARVACELESGSFSESGTEVATEVVVLCK